MKTTVYVILVILFAAVGLWLHKDFMECSFLSLDTAENIILFNRTLEGAVSKTFFFSFIICLLPLLYLLVEKTTKIKFIYKGLITSAIIVLAGIIVWRLRIYGLNAQFEELSKFNLPDRVQQNFNVDMLKFEVYLLMGFIIGTLISILIFRDKNKPLLN